MKARRESRRFSPMFDGLDLRIAPATFAPMPSTSGMTTTLPYIPSQPEPTQPATTVTTTLPSTSC